MIRNTDAAAAADALRAVPRAALERLLEAQLLRHNLERYMRWAWEVDPSHRGKPLRWNWHLGAKAEHLQACRRGEIKRLIINEPPRHLKSWTVSVAFPTWVWASDPSVQFLCASSDRDVVYRDADAMRDMCTSQQYVEMFRPDWTFRTLDGRQQDAKGYYRNSAGGHRISKAMGQKSQGVNADFLIIDDPLDASDAYGDKAALVDHVIHARQKLLTRLNDPETGVVILIMQRLHELDLAGVWLEEGGWTHLRMPAEYDGGYTTTWSGWTPPELNEGDILHEDRTPRAFLEQRRRDLGARGYAGQYMQAPAPAKGAMVRRQWLRYWTPGELPEMSYIMASWDCTFGGRGGRKSDQDYVVGQVWGVGNELAHLLDQVRERMDVTQMIAAMREMHRVWPNILATVVEERAAGKHVMDTLTGELYGIEGFNPGGQSKEERLNAVLPLFEQGRVYLPHPVLASTNEQNYSWVREVYEKELLTFPGASHDDQVDATSQALIWIMGNGFGEGAQVKVL